MTLQKACFRGLLGVMVTSFMIGCSSPQPTLLSWRTDAQWWQQATQQQAYLSSPTGQKITVNPQTARTIIHIQNALENHVKRSFELVISALHEANAYALWTRESPQILITTGLLEQWGDDEEALAYAMAHELAHHVLDHTHEAGVPISSESSANNIISQGLTWIMPIPSFIASTSNSFWHGHINQSMENAADQLALEWLKALGYRSCGAQRLLKSWANTPQHLSNSIWAYHPHPLDRAQQMTSYCAPQAIKR